MSRKLTEIAQYIWQKAEKNEGVRLNNVEARRLARYLDMASNEVPTCEVEKMKECQ